MWQQHVDTQTNEREGKAFPADFSRIHGGILCGSYSYSQFHIEPAPDSTHYPELLMANEVLGFWEYDNITNLRFELDRSPLNLKSALVENTCHGMRARTLYEAYKSYYRSLP